MILNILIFAIYILICVAVGYHFYSKGYKEGYTDGYNHQKHDFAKWMF